MHEAGGHYCIKYNKYVSTPYSWAKLNAGRFERCPGKSRWVCRWDRQTDRQKDGRTPNRYITLSAMDAASV